MDSQPAGQQHQLDDGSCVGRGLIKASIGGGRSGVIILLISLLVTRAKARWTEPPFADLLLIGIITYLISVDKSLSLLLCLFTAAKTKRQSRCCPRE